MPGADEISLARNRDLGFDTREEIRTPKGQLYGSVADKVAEQGLI